MQLKNIGLNTCGERWRCTFLSIDKWLLGAIESVKCSYDERFSMHKPIDYSSEYIINNFMIYICIYNNTIDHLLNHLFTFDAFCSDNKTDIEASNSEIYDMLQMETDANLPTVQFNSVFYSNNNVFTIMDRCDNPNKLLEYDEHIS